VEIKGMMQPFATKKIMADDSNEEESGSQQNRQSTRKRDPMDSTREVPKGATTTKRIVCKGTTQSSVTTFTNVKLE
jgi:hypothetical protein